MNTLTSPPTVPPPLSDVSSPRGAPMGRGNTLPDDTSAPIALLVERLEWRDGDYDSGGAYWGGGMKDWIWRATGDDGENAVEVFVRAKCYQSTTDALSRILPAATFTASTTIDREAFFVGYVKTALWSSVDDDGDALDAKYSDDDLADATREQMRKDCNEFIDANAADLAASELSVIRCGHNFWLNRNGHGAGFWDDCDRSKPGQPEACNRLSDASRAAGTFDLCIGDGGKVRGY
jgi:hypothetical protein